MAVRRILCATVLIAEAFVVFFALLVAATLSDLSTATVLTLGISTALACLVLAGLLKHRWAYGAGSVLQVVLILAGFVVPAMFFLGAVFAGLWVLSLVLARRVEQFQAAAAESSPTR